MQTQPHGMSIIQMADVFQQFYSAYGCVRLFKYENYHYGKEEFIFFTSDPSVIYTILTEREYPDVSVSCYTKEQPAHIYIDVDDYKLDVEFYSN